jgi:ParB family chromosome partitioning protein
VVNPRVRNKKKFQQMTQNIADVGLKKPITVRPCDDGRYELVCGQGRLESLQKLGQTEVPAVISQRPRDEIILGSLVENIARHTVSTMEAMSCLADLRDRGYTHEDIGRKTGLSGGHVCDLLTLYDHGEERLLYAVQSESIGIKSAIIIARCQGSAEQEALIQLQQEQQLGDSELRRLRNLINSRKIFGPKLRGNPHQRHGLTTEGIVRAVKREQERQREAVKKAELCEKRLLFATQALKCLFRDDYFITLLRAEGLSDLPQYLADQLQGELSHD